MGKITTTVANGAARPDLANIYGAGQLVLNSLRNLRVGRNGSMYAAAARFVAQKSGAIKRLWFYTPNGSGYSGGNGGTLRIRICGLNANMQPDTSKVYGTATFSDSTGVSAGKDTMQWININNAQALTAGTRYSVVFDNTVDSSGNFRSVNTVQAARYMGGPCRWVSYDDWGSLFSTNNGQTWSDLTQGSAETDMITVPILEFETTGGDKYGLVVIESGAVKRQGGDRYYVASSRWPVREAVYIPAQRNIGAFSVMFGTVNPGNFLFEIHDEATGNVLYSGSYATPNRTSDSVYKEAAKTIYPTSEWFDIPFKNNISIAADRWITWTITPQDNCQMSFCASTNGRRREVDEPCSYMSGEARTRNSANNAWIPFNYHSHGNANGNRNDVNWRAVFHFGAPPKATTTQGGGGGANTGGGKYLSTAQKELIHRISTGTNAKRLRPWDSGANGAVSNGSSGQGGGAAIVQGALLNIRERDRNSWISSPWRDSGSFEWVKTQMMNHFNVWGVAMEYSDNTVNNPWVEHRNARVYILRKGQTTWESVVHDTMGTGSWCEYFHPDMKQSVSTQNYNGVSSFGPVPKRAVSGGGVAFQLTTRWPWPGAHWSAAAIKWNSIGINDPEAVIEALMVSVECRLASGYENASVGLQLGGDCKIYGNNASDRAEWYPGFGTSSIQPVTKDWQFFGFATVLNAQGGHRDIVAPASQRAITRDKFFASNIPNYMDSASSATPDPVTVYEDQSNDWSTDMDGAKAGQFGDIPVITSKDGMVDWRLTGVNIVQPSTDTPAGNGAVETKPQVQPETINGGVVSRAYNNASLISFGFGSGTGSLAKIRESKVDAMSAVPRNFVFEQFRGLRTYDQASDLTRHKGRSALKIPSSEYTPGYITNEWGEKATGSDVALLNQYLGLVNGNAARIQFDPTQIFVIDDQVQITKFTVIVGGTFVIDASTRRAGFLINKVGPNGGGVSFIGCRFFVRGDNANQEACIYYTDSSCGLFIDGCLFGGIGQGARMPHRRAVTIRSTSGNECKNVNIRNCVVRGPDQQAFATGGAGASSILVSSALSGATRPSYESTGKPPTITGATSIVNIHSNVIDGGYYGIGVEGCNDISIKYNQISNPMRGISIQDGSYNIIVHGNSIYDSISSGIHIAFGTSNTTVSCNSVQSNVAHGQGLLQCYVDTKDITFSNNRTCSLGQGSKYAVYVGPGSARATIVNNRIEGVAQRAYMAIEQEWTDVVKGEAPAYSAHSDGDNVVDDKGLPENVSVNRLWHNWIDRGAANTVPQIWLSNAGSGSKDMVFTSVLQPQNIVINNVSSYIKLSRSYELSFNLARRTE